MLKRQHLAATLVISLLSALFVGVVPVQAAASKVTCSGGVWVNESSYIDIVDNVVTGSNGCVGAVVIPEGVISIAANSLDGNASPGITSFSFPASLSEIVDGSLGIHALTSINLAEPNTNFRLAGGVLFNDLASTLVLYSGTGSTYEIPSAVQSIGTYAFQGNSQLTAVTTATNSQLATVGPMAFVNMAGLATFILPASLTTIGTQAFQASGLTSINIPPLVTSIPASAFGWTASLGAVTIDANSTLASIDAEAFRGSHLTSIGLLPSTLTAIGAGAFSNTLALNSIALPSGLMSIGDEAFRGSAINSITVPQRVTSLGAYAFADALSLVDVIFQGPTPSLLAIQDSTFENTSALISIVLPPALSSIGQYAFQGSALRSISIPQSVSSIGEYAFKDAIGLVAVVFEGANPGLTVIRGNVFGNTTALTSITLPPGLRTIGSFAFKGSGLLDIDIPAGVIEVGYGSFQSALSLRYVDFLGNNVERIRPYAFYNTALGSLALPEGLLTVGEGAFGSSQLSRIDFPASLLDLSLEAFQDASNLKDIYFLGNAPRIIFEYRGTAFDTPTDLCAPFDLDDGDGNIHRAMTSVLAWDAADLVNVHIATASLGFTSTDTGFCEVVAADPTWYGLKVFQPATAPTQNQNDNLPQPTPTPTPTPTAPVVLEPAATKVVRFSRFVADSGKLPALAGQGIARTLSGYSTIDRVVCTGFTSGVKATAVGRKVALQRAQNACNVAKRLAPKAFIQVRVNVASGVGPKFRSVQLNITGN